jgi:uncharacterized protein (UPF0261 family)
MNKTHGLRRTNQDKARAVEAALKHPAAATKSNVEIAEHCGVAESYVRKLKGGGIFAQSEDGTKTVTRGGVTYTVKTGNIGKKKKPAAAAIPEKQRGRVLSGQWGRQHPRDVFEGQGSCAKI